MPPLEMDQAANPFGVKVMTNYFLDSRYDSEATVQVEEIQLNSKRVSEGLQDYEAWSCEQPILISAPTGSGKNYFIVHELLPYAIQTTKQILYVSNRVALDYQQKKEIIDVVGRKELLSRYTPDGLVSEYEDFGNIHVLTYHKLCGYIQNKEWLEKTPFNYVVFDECHFFYSDALFNARTFFIMSRIPSVFCDSVRIYISATPEEIIDPLYACEKDIWKKRHPTQQKSSYGLVEPLVFKIKKYTMRPNFSPYNIFYFSDKDEIINKIDNDKSHNKWIIFINNKKLGHELLLSINGDKSAEEDGTGNSQTPADNKTKEEPKAEEESKAVMITADSRNLKDNSVEKIAWNTLENEGSFTQKVLIVTSVLDNGFSLKKTGKNSVNNIVIFTHDRTEFLQELGRRRIESGDNVDLYIYNITKSELAALRTYCFEYSKEIEKYDESYIKILQEYWTPDENKYRSMFYIDSSGELIINKMARWRVLRMKQEIEKINADLQRYKDNEGGIRYKLDWLGGRAKYRRNKSLSLSEKEKASDELINFLESYVGKVIREEEFLNFSQKLKDLYTAIKPDPADNHGDRKDGIRALNNRLKKYAPEYIIKRDKKGYFVDKSN